MNDPFPSINQLAPLLDELAADASTDQDLATPTGFEDLDETLAGGLRVGQVTLIAGIPGVGTTTFALGLARNAAFRASVRTLILAPDLSKREILIRVVAAEAKLPVGRLRGRHIDDSDRHGLARHREALMSGPLVVDAGWSIQGTADNLVDRARVAMTEGTQLVVLDGLSVAEPRARELVKRLKTLALVYRASVVVVSKAVVSRHRLGTRPAFEDLREYEEIADLVDLAVMLHRDDVHDCESVRPGEADLEIIKHRYGPSRRITLAFQGHYARFVDMRS